MFSRNSLILILSSLVGGQVAALELSKESRFFLEDHCFDCHDSGTTKGDLNLETATFDPNDPASYRLWETVMEHVDDNVMPPKKKLWPPADEKAAFLAALREPLLEANRAQHEKEGRVVRRRINRTEYEYTLRDLMHLPHLDVREELPADSESHGFDTVGEALNLSYVQMVKYLEVADSALNQAIVGEKLPSPASPELVRRDFTTLGRFNSKSGESRPLGETSRIVLRQPNSAQTPWFVGGLNAKTGGLYRVRFSCNSLFYDDGKVEPSDREHVIRLMGALNKSARVLKVYDVPQDEPGVLEAEVWLNEGEGFQIEIPTLDDRNEPISNTKRGLPYRGPGMAFHWIELEGPFVSEGVPESHRALFGDLPLQVWKEKSGFIEPSSGKLSKKAVPMMVVSDRPEVDAKRLLRSFMERATRRPVNDVQVVPFLELVKKSLEERATFDRAMLVGFKAILCSEDFLFLQEAPGVLDDYALAARLSYFLWKSLPDDELMVLAQKGELRQPDVLRAQTERLLADPKSQRFTGSFLDLWLELRRIGFTEPDEQLYPEFSPFLQDSMVTETREFFKTMLQEDLPVDHLVQSDFTYANAALAELYGIPGVKGSQLRRVEFPKGSPRGGFLTQGSVLKITANGTTTSPVTRGAWILERLLGDPVPPPPPGAGSIEPDVRGTITVREQLEAHRANESCASCHVRIDPPGFALENFDVIGSWRDHYRSLEKGEKVQKSVKGKDVRYRKGLAVDSSGQSSDGRAFENIHDFREILLSDREQLARNMASKLLVFATGAPIELADEEEVEKIVEAARERKFGLRSLVHEIVQSSIFQKK